ncbi:MAG TPA: hypothetical protein ENN07_07280 [candidate division Zixibacteria bacterium]|nr:hypothetical protein [candidate division Zixibacteria bacterium]
MRRSAFITLIAVLLLALPLSAQMKHPIVDDGTPVPIGSMVKLNALGQISACGDNDADVAGIVIAVMNEGGTDFYLLASSDVFPARLDGAVTAGDRLTTSASGALRTAVDGEMSVGWALEDGHATELRRAIISLDYPQAVDWDTLGAYADTNITNALFDTLGAYLDTNYTIDWDTLGAYLDTNYTGDNLGDHTATENLQMSGFWISNDGGDEGLFVDTDGNVGIGTDSPEFALDVDGGVMMRGDRYWGTDASGADSFWIYDDGDTTRFNSDNPIKIGNSSLIVETDGDVFASQALFIGTVPEGSTDDSVLVHDNTTDQVKKVAPGDIVDWDTLGAIYDSIGGMQFSGVSTIKVHKTDTLLNPTTNQWLPFKMSEGVAEESFGTAFTWPAIVGGSPDSTVILINEDGLYDFSGCVHFRNMAGSAMSNVKVLTRVIQITNSMADTVEARCGQREWIGNLEGNYVNSLSYRGTAYLEDGDLVQLQYRVSGTNANFAFLNDPAFDRRVSATILLQRIK